MHSDKESLTATLHDPHFNSFAALFSIAISPKWRLAHPEVPDVRSILDRLARLSRSLPKDATSIRNSFVKEFTLLLVQIVEADSRLHYSTDDLDWLYSMLDGIESDPSHVRAILSMLFAVAVTPREFLTVEQLVEVSGEGASTWRARAANGDIIGAWKAGKTWMFPVLSLRAYGVNVERSVLKIEEDTEEE